MSEEEKVDQSRSPEKYTVFHAFFEALKDKEEKAKRSTGLAKRELRMPGTAGIRLKGALKFLINWARRSI